MSGNNDLTPAEELLVLKIGLVAFAAVVGSVFTLATWHKVLGWLVTHQVLVPAAEGPLVTVPAGGGVGLDGPRLAIAVSAVVVALVSGIGALRRHFAAMDRE